MESDQPLLLIASGADWLESMVADVDNPSWARLVGTRLLLTVLMIIWLWATRRKKSPGWALAPVLVITGVSLLRVSAMTGADTDEVEHIHVSWLITQDVLPFRDVHQNHAPLAWLLGAPLFWVLPESAGVVYAFRALALVALLSCAVLACLILRQWERLEAARFFPACLFLLMSHAVESQIYRFRPDVFMVACALASLYLLLRPGRRLWFQFLLAGFFLGLAITFTPKVVLQVGVAGVVLLIYLLRWKPLQAAGLGVALGVGIVLGLMPVAIWLGAHELMGDAWQSIFPQNAAMISQRRTASSWMESGRLLPRVLNLAPSIALALVGALAAMRLRFLREMWRGDRSMAPVLVAVSAVLFFLLMAVAPNYLTYHVAGGLVLVAVLGAGPLQRLLDWGRSSWRVVISAVVVVVMLNDTWFRSGIAGRVEGVTAEVAHLEELRRETARRGGTCVCLAPMHPIFALDIGGHYTGLDRHSSRWGEALEEILREPPGVIMDFAWQGLVLRGRLIPQQYAELTELLDTRYEPKVIGPERFWLRSDELSP